MLSAVKRISAKRFRKIVSTPIRTKLMTIIFIISGKFSIYCCYMELFCISLLERYYGNIL